MITVLDCETTGMEPGGVVEIAGVLTPRSGALNDWFSALTDPECPIEIGAMSIHHITEEDVRGQPPLSVILDRVEKWGSMSSVLAAHNAAFDRKFLPQLADRAWICTWRCALHLFPDAPGHSNQELRYWLQLDVSDMPEKAGGSSHRALYDAWTTAKLLERLIDEVQNPPPLRGGPVVSLAEVIEHLIKLTTQPVILRKVRFGKHRGELWEHVPRGYLTWVLKQGDMDEDVRHTARHWLHDV